MISKCLHIKFIKAALLTGCFFICSCHNNYQQVQDLARKKLPEDKAIDVISYFSQNGITKAKLTTPLMTMMQSDTPQTEFPRTLHVDFFDSVKLQSRLFAKYGLYYSSRHLVYLKDSVIIFNVQGDTLLSEELWWDQDKELIYTDKDVHIRKPDGEKTDGKGLTANQNFSSWTILNAKSIMNVPDSTLPAN